MKKIVLILALILFSSSAVYAKDSVSGGDGGVGPQINPEYSDKEEGKGTEEQKEVFMYCPEGIKENCVEMNEKQMEKLLILLKLNKAINKEEKK